MQLTGTSSGAPADPLSPLQQQPVACPSRLPFNKCADGRLPGEIAYLAEYMQAVQGMISLWPSTTRGVKPRLNGAKASKPARH